jgi:hypothetical protein
MKTARAHSVSDSVLEHHSSWCEMVRAVLNNRRVRIIRIMESQFLKAIWLMLYQRRKNRGKGIAILGAHPVAETEDQPGIVRSPWIGEVCLLRNSCQCLRDGEFLSVTKILREAINAQIEVPTNLYIECAAYVAVSRECNSMEVQLE